MKMIDKPCPRLYYGASLTLLQFEAKNVDLGV